MKNLILAIGITFLIFGSRLKGQVVLYQYNATWSGSGVTVNGVITFNSSFSSYNPSSVGQNDYNGSINDLIDNLSLTVTGDPNPAYNGTFTIQNYDEAQWNTGGNLLNLNNGNLVPQFGPNADLALIIYGSSLAPASGLSDPLLTLRTGNGDGTLVTLQSMSAVPEPEEWMAITSAALVVFVIFYSKIHKKALKD